MNTLPVASDRSYYLNTMYNNDSLLFNYQKNFVDFVANNCDNTDKLSKLKMILLMFEAGTGKTLAYLKLCERLIINGIYKRVFIVTRTVLFQAIKHQLPPSIESAVHFYSFITFTQEIMQIDIELLINDTIIIFDEVQLALGDQDNEGKESQQTRLCDFRNVCTKLYIHIAYNAANTLTIFSTATLMVNTANNIINFANVFYRHQWLADTQFGGDVRALNEYIQTNTAQSNELDAKIENNIAYYKTYMTNCTRLYKQKQSDMSDIRVKLSEAVRSGNTNEIRQYEVQIEMINTQAYQILQNFNAIECYIANLDRQSKSGGTITMIPQIPQLYDLNFEEITIADDDDFDENDNAKIHKITKIKNNNYGLTALDTELKTQITADKGKRTIMRIPDVMLMSQYDITDPMVAVNFITQYTHIFKYKNDDDIQDQYMSNYFIKHDEAYIYNYLHRMYGSVDETVHNSIVTELNKSFIIPLSRLQYYRMSDNMSYILNELQKFNIQPNHIEQQSFGKNNRGQTAKVDKAFKHDYNMKLLKMFHNFYEFQYIDAMFNILSMNSNGMDIRNYICACCDIIAKVNPMIAFIILQLLLSFYNNEPGMSIIYYEDQVQNGMNEFAMCLNLIEKYSPDKSLLSISDITKSEPTITKAFKYCLVDGKTCHYYNNNHKDKFNSAENVDGSLCNLVIFSKVFKEGVSFSNVLRKFYPVFSWNQTTKYQVEHRTLRSDSFIHFTDDILKLPQMQKYLDVNGKIFPHNYTLMYSTVDPNEPVFYLDYDKLLLNLKDKTFVHDFNGTCFDPDTGDILQPDLYEQITFSDLFDMWNKYSILSDVRDVIRVPIYLDVLRNYVQKQQMIDKVNEVISSCNNRHLIKTEDTSTDPLAYNIFEILNNLTQDEVNLVYLILKITGMNIKIPNARTTNAKKTSDYTVMPCVNIAGNVSSKTKKATVSKLQAIEYRSINQK